MTVSSKRLFDLIVSLGGLVVVSPFLLAAAIAIRLDSPGSPLFLQERVGRNGRKFRIIKLRTMRSKQADDSSQITVGKDPRITRVGYWLRKTKFDELPQLLNVIRGEMSIVGPRPEVCRYIEQYSATQQQILLSVRPGITDYAAIEFKDEAEILASAIDPETAYLNEIMPRKFELYERYIKQQSLKVDIGIIIRTLFKLVSR